MVKKGYKNSIGLMINELSEEMIYFSYTDTWLQVYDKSYFSKSTTMVSIVKTTYKNHNDSFVITLYRSRPSTYGVIRNHYNFVYMNGCIYSHNQKFKRIPKEIKEIVSEFMKERIQ